MDAFLPADQAREAFAEVGFLSALLCYAAALARAQAQAGLIPAAAAQSIAGTCKVELFDTPKIVLEGTRRGDIGQALVDSLKETVGIFNPEASAYVHYGAKDQDGFHSAKALAASLLVTQILASLERTVGQLHALAERHAADPVLERVALQPVAISTAGCLCFQWAMRLQRCQTSLQARASQALCVHWSAAEIRPPPLSALVLQVRLALSGALGLDAANSLQRSVDDDWTAMACELALAGSALGSMAADLACMAQAEVGEFGVLAHAAQEPSIAAVCQHLLANAQRAPQRLASCLVSTQQQAPHADWSAQLSQWSDQLLSTLEAAGRMEQLVQQAAFDAKRMRLNAQTWLTAQGKQSQTGRFSFQAAQGAAERLRLALSTYNPASLSAAIYSSP